MCLNRVETADSVCIVQAFSPCLFQQNDLPGPNLFLKFWRGQLTPKECVAKWVEENKQKKKSRAVDWPKKMPLFCRGCSDAVDKDIQNSLDQFPRRNKSNILGTLIAEGMERFCNACRRSGRLKNLTDNTPDDHSTDSEEGKNETEEQTYVQCKKCLAHLNRASFDRVKMEHWIEIEQLRRDAVCLACEGKEKRILCTICKTEKGESSFDPQKLATWKKNCNISREAKCLACEAKKKKEDSITCTICETELGSSSFDPKKLATWKKNCDIRKHAKCLACEAKNKEDSLKCVRCEKVKSRNDYDPIMLERWTKNRDLAKKAACKNCAAARGMKTHEPKKSWQKATYKCSKCKADYAPNKFAYATLAALEADGQTFLAICLHCNPVIYETHALLKPVTCVACKKLKERKEFSLERQRHSTLATRCELIRPETDWQLTGK